MDEPKVEQVDARLASKPSGTRGESANEVEA